MIGEEPICTSCRHYWDAYDSPTGGFFCDAFPYEPGIPDEIIYGDFNHRNAHPADNGIRYEPIVSRV